MTRKQAKNSILTFLILLIAINLPFLPGPNFLNGPAQLLFSAGQLLGLLGLLAVPIGLLWFLSARNKKTNLFRPVIFTIIFSAPLVSLIFLTDSLRDFSRNMAIKNGNKLIRQIEKYHKMNGHYPKNINPSIFTMPHSGIIGIEPYYYRKNKDNFELFFNQNVLLGFNFEIVTYNNKNEQKAQGELKTLYPTCDKNWKYEIFD